MDKHRIMGNNNNSMHKHNKLPPMDKDNSNTHNHINKTPINKVMPSKAMPTEIHMDNNKVTIPMVKWVELAHYRLRGRSKCLTTEQLHNHNLMDRRDRRTHQRK